jgi:hypothetical protein
MELMLEHSESIAKLADALNKAQQQMEKAKKDSNNPFFKSKYADLSAVWDACKDAVLSNGFCVMQPLAGTDEKGNTLIVTMLVHTSGEWIKGVLAMPSTKSDPQQVGSAITYGRRYSLAAMLNVMLEDDDGESAMGRNQSVAKGNNQIPVKASPKQATYLNSLMQEGKIDKEAVKGALAENNVSRISDLPSAVVSSLINGAIPA